MIKKNYFILFILLISQSFASCYKEGYNPSPSNLVAKNVEADFSLPFIIVNGIKLHSEAFGNPGDTMIVAIHGGPGSDYRYMLNCKELSEHGYYVVFYDQVGSGLSQRLGKEKYSSRGADAVTDMMDELKAVIEHSKTSTSQKVILLGHSWGGILATGFVGKCPGFVNGLIVFEPGGLKWADIKTYVKHSRSFKLWGEILNDATYLDQFIPGIENQHDILDYNLNILASKNDITGEDNTLPGSFWRSGATVNTALLEIGEKYEPDFSVNVQSFLPKTLFLYSEKNQAYGDAWATQLSSSYRTVKLQKIIGMGHNGMISDNLIWQQQTLPYIIQYIHSL